MVEQYKLAVISTAHLEQRTAEYLESAHRAMPYIVAPFEQGFYVSCQRVPDEDETGRHPSLHAVRQWAAANGFPYVMLDRDADQVDGLPAYDW